MLDTLLRTKLFVPRPRPSLTPRPRLLAQLNRGLERGSRLTLISAPAGSGKSTLAAAWLAAADRPAAWLSLDAGDGDPRHFLAYLAAALQTLDFDAAPAPGADLLARLQAPQPLPLQTLLATLINELAAVPQPFLLVLDDYHQVDEPQIDDLLSFLLDNLPPPLHLVLCSREDPNLPLPRLRVRGQLTELRAADLRFTHEEAADFLNQLMELGLSAEEIAALEARTEGWVAGLQMAALALQRAPASAADEARAEFIRDFTGSHRFVLDYLFAEVLQRQPPPVRDFLLQTAILERLSGPLCDAVCYPAGQAPPGREDGRHLLITLERDNLFLVPLDDNREWYRYHHLFADVLRTHLLADAAFDVPVLHRRASSWFAQNGRPAAAIRHALAAPDYARAARLLELAWPEMDGSFRSAAWLAWAAQLPVELVRARPMLTTQFALALLDNGNLDEAEVWLEEVARRLDPQKGTLLPAAENAGGPDRTDADERRLLPALIALGRAQLALIRGDLAAVDRYAAHSRRLAGDDPLRHAQAGALLGISSWNRGDLDAAHRAMSDWVDNMLQLGNNYFAVASTFVLADIREMQGRLHDARRTYERSLQFAAGEDPALERVITHHYLGLARLTHEMGEDEAAARYLARAEELGPQSVLIDWPHRYHLALAEFREAAGKPAAALALLEEAERLYLPNPAPVVCPLSARKARMQIKLGRLDPAREWAAAEGVTITTPASFMNEYGLITLARLHLAEIAGGADTPEWTAVHDFLTRLLSAARAGGRRGSIVEILLLQALAYHAGGNDDDARETLEEALGLAELTGHFRVFINEGDRLVPLLRAAAQRETAAAQAVRLLAAYSSAPPDAPPAPAETTQPLADPLSPRELDVLRLLQTELTGPEIARELVVALSTVRSHTKSIYSKLDVGSRRAAVNRARALGLI